MSDRRLKKDVEVYGLAGHLLNAGAWIGDDLNRIAVKLGFTGCSEMVEFNDTHTHAEVLARVDEGIRYWILLDLSNRELVW